MIDSILNKIKTEPVRVRLYSVAALIAVFLVAKGAVSPVDLEFFLSLAALVLGVETSRARVTPTANA